MEVNSRGSRWKKRGRDASKARREELRKIPCAKVCFVTF